MKNKSTASPRWDLTPLFKNASQKEIISQRKAVEKESGRFIDKWKKRKDYLVKPPVLKKALDEYEYWARNFGCNFREVYYFELLSAQDQSDTAMRAKLNQAAEISRKICNDISFFKLNIAKIKPSDRKKFLNYGPLKDYKHFLERIFRSAKYNLSEAEERILNLSSMTSYSNWVNMTSSFLSKEERRISNQKGKSELKSFSQLMGLLDNKNKKIRDSSAEAVNEIFSKYAETAEWELNSILALKKMEDELRKMERPDLERHIADDTESAIVDTLIKTVADNFRISQRYYRLKAKLFKVKKLKYHERNVPYGIIESDYSFADSITLIDKVFRKLDPQFAEIFNKFIKNGQVDVFPKKGKQSGAFCAHRLLNQPSYVLLNYANRLNDVMTIAHEFGHAINNELMRKQNALNFGTSLSVAEVASTFMEDFVLKEILENADDELKLAIMLMRLNDAVSSIFRQVACYKFELELHAAFRNKGYLSKEEIGIIFHRHMKSYMGEAVEQSQGSQNWWVYWSHIRNFFYVYSYANGLLISKSLQNSVEKNPKFILKVKELLSFGLFDSPKNSFQKIGLDVTKRVFWEKGIKEIDKLLKETEKLARKLGKI